LVDSPTPLVWTRRRLVVALLLGAVALSLSCRKSPESGRDNLGFPVPERPVAPVISAAFSDEQTRDANGEAERVMDRLGIQQGLRVGDIGAGEGYYTVRLARRLGQTGAIYAEDIMPEYLNHLQARLEREKITGIRLVLGTPNDPKLPSASIDVALLAHVYHEIENPYEFLYRLWSALRLNGRIGIVDLDRPTQNHGTPPALLRCELAAVDFRQIDFLPLTPAEGYLAVFSPPDQLPPIGSIKPCKEY
jgi:SAM-dependent methyltransferase